MPKSATIERLVPWLVRLAWIAVLAVGGEAVDGATAERSNAVSAVARIGGVGWWVLGVAAMAIPAVVSLTATRLIVPLAVPAAGLAWSTGAEPVEGALFFGVAALTSVMAFSGEFGRTFVQASAYGDEDRHLLRPPAAYAFVAALTWAIWATCLIAGPLLLASHGWALGTILTALGAAGALWGWPRWHRLSRRWFVVVPVGIVVHDHLVLAETLMLRRQEIDRIRLAPADTEAADLTGPAAGHAVEIATSEPVTVIVAATPSEPRGKAIHLTACLVSPTRPGRALRAAGARRLRVG